jgi:iron uptake system component EfeO
LSFLVFWSWFWSCSGPVLVTVSEAPVLVARRRPHAVPAARAALVAALAVPALAACGSGGESTGAASPASSSSPPSATSGSAGALGSAEALRDAAANGTSGNPLADQAAARYATYVQTQAAAIVADTKQLTDAVRAGNLAQAKAEFAASRVAWERIEPIAALVEEFDGAIDARVDDFAGETDPEFTGWHRIEYHLFEQGDTSAAAPFADRLDADVTALAKALADLEIPPAAMAVGAAELVEEVSEGKITGEEDRYSGTDLSDFAANIDGSQAAVDLLAPALALADNELLTQIRARFAAVHADLEPYRDGDGWQPYSALTDADRDRMKADLGALSESLALVAGTLGLQA